MLPSGFSRCHYFRAGKGERFRRQLPTLVLVSAICLGGGMINISNPNPDPTLVLKAPKYIKPILRIH